MAGPCGSSLGVEGDTYLSDCDGFLRHAPVASETDTALALPLGFAFRAACGGTCIISLC